MYITHIHLNRFSSYISIQYSCIIVLVGSNPPMQIVAPIKKNVKWCFIILLRVHKFGYILRIGEFTLSQSQIKKHVFDFFLFYVLIFQIFNTYKIWYYFFVPPQLQKISQSPSQPHPHINKFNTDFNFPKSPNVENSNYGHDRYYLSF